MSVEKGNLSINSENIFPIIKKWLYSDQDIFIRELVSNGCDAITKLRKLEVMGEYHFEADQEFSIQVIANPKEKTLKFVDNGIGMTADEIKEYINQIAFSGAEAFLKEYKDKTSEDQIIGHFGLGFYSAFMVADKVTIDSLSYKEGAEAVHWECDGGTTFEMGASDKDMVGTEVTLYLNEDCYEYSNEYRVKEVLKKYCSFMPEEIYFVNTEDLTGQKAKEAEEAAKKAEEEAAKQKAEAAGDETDLPEDEETPAEDAEVEAEEEGPKPINNTHPLWTKHQNDCTDEEYKDFYRDVFNDFREPLFWIHLNMDYPYNLKGILYFPRLENKFDRIEGVIKLYNNQVFVADNVKEVIPEFLMLLKGVIDCPDLPLNVSRSALQNDGFVKVISDYITKKVADKLSGMCKTKRDEYEKYWDDINPFIKFGCLKDPKFCERMSDYILFKDLEDKYLTMKELIEKNQKQDAEEGADSSEKAASDSEEKNIYYVSDREAQGQYINMFRDAGLDAVYLEHIIDSSFVTQLESKNEGVHFKRIDTALSDTFKNETSEEEKKELEEKASGLQEKVRKVAGLDQLEVKLENLKNAEISSMLTVSEEDKRMEDMIMHMGMGNLDVSKFKKLGTLVLNSNNELVQYVLSHQNEEQTDIIIEQLYDLAKLGNEPLSAADMSKFIARSNQIMLLLAGK